MGKTTSVEEARKKVFLVGIQEGNMSRAEVDSLAKELLRLVDTLGLEVASQEIVHVREKQAKYGVGTGKAEELAQKATSMEVDCVILDRDLSPSQQRNWEELTGISVIDRQELIIQIFASRARTREAELQAGLAQLVYTLPRLRHKYIDLSRQRGGRYGTRGAGETRLETDRRRLEKRIHRMEEELDLLKRRRQVQRKQRERHGVAVCALVGYTNAGKSSLLNSLTGAEVLAEDKLFATLDSTSRKLKLPEAEGSRTQIILVDTVGFIRRLPHSLINAFRSTLEEASRADLILNVLDASDPDIATHHETTLSVLGELGAGDIPRITVLNKIDRIEFAKTSRGVSGETSDNISIEALLKLFPRSIPVSAVSGKGLPELCSRIETLLVSQKKNQSEQ